TSFQSISHSDQLEFADRSLQPEQEAVVGISGIVDAVLVCEQGPKDSTHLQKIIPIFVVAGDVAHLDSQDQADMLHGNFGEDSLKTTPFVGGPAALSLIVVDDQNPIPGPSPSYRQVGEGVLPFPRFAMSEDLLGIGLAHVHDEEEIEVAIQD